MKPLSLTSFFLILAFFANAQIGFQVSPGKVFFRQTAGQQQSQAITVSNTSGSPMALKCSFIDWVRDSMGNKVYAEPGTYRHSNSRYAKIFPDMFTLQPGETRNIEVSLLLPDGADTAVTNSMLFITQVEEKTLGDEKSKNKEAFMKFRIQIGVHVYNEPPQMQFKNIEIEKVDVTEKWEESVNFNKNTQKKDTVRNFVRSLSALIHNNGDLVAEGSVRFELTHKSSQKEFKLEPITFNSLPGDKIIMPASLTASLPKGRYSVVTLVDYGMDQPLKVAESEIELK